jgi:hypothetical protein
MHDAAAFTTAVEFDPAWLDEPFTMVPTAWARMGLRWEDMGLLFWLRTHKKGFRFTETFMIAATPGGRDKVRAILQRLEKAGVIKRRKDRDAAGRITGVTFIVLYPAFGTAGPWTDNPSLDRDQGKQGGAAGGTSDGSAVAGKAVLGSPPAEIDAPESTPSPEKPSMEADQAEHYRLPGQTYDGFPNDGKANDGKSATKKEQLKGKSPQRNTTTTSGAAGTVQVGAGAEPDGSGSSGSSPETEHHAAAVNLLRAAVDATAAQRLTAAQVSKLAQGVAALLAAGVSAASLRAQLAPVTSASTKYPFERLTKRIEEIAAGGTNPLAAPTKPSPTGVYVNPDGVRHLGYRPCGKGDCTGGGLAVGAGSAPYRRRIDPDTGGLDQLCDRPVTTLDGQTVPCHPDAVLKSASVTA